MKGPPRPFTCLEEISAPRSSKSEEADDTGKPGRDTARSQAYEHEENDEVGEQGRTGPADHPLESLDGLFGAAGECRVEPAGREPGRESKQNASDDIEHEVFLDEEGWRG